MVKENTSTENNIESSTVTIEGAVQSLCGITTEEDINLSSTDVAVTRVVDVGTGDVAATGTNTINIGTGTVSGGSKTVNIGNLTDDIVFACDTLNLSAVSGIGGVPSGTACIESSGVNEWDTVGAAVSLNPVYNLIAYGNGTTDVTLETVFAIRNTPATGFVASNTLVLYQYAGASTNIDMRVTATHYGDGVAARTAVSTFTVTTTTTLRFNIVQRASPVTMLPTDKLVHLKVERLGATGATDGHCPIAWTEIGFLYQT